MDAFLRFMSKVDITGGADSCWPWLTFRDKDGYGNFWEDGRSRRAPRWLLGHLRGTPLGADEVACHRCDNPPCVNPAHLYVGTWKDNTRDRGERTGHGSPLASINAAKTHCPQGHEYNNENTRVYRGKRLCRPCRRVVEENQRLRRAREAAATLSA